MDTLSKEAIPFSIRVNSLKKQFAPIMHINIYVFIFISQICLLQESVRSGYVPDFQSRRSSYAA